jgi:hypothetical protein
VYGKDSVKYVGISLPVDGDELQLLEWAASMLSMHNTSCNNYQVTIILHYTNYLNTASTCLKRQGQVRVGLLPL